MQEFNKENYYKQGGSKPLQETVFVFGMDLLFWPLFIF